ncbi:MAG: peptidoglycan-binding protein LysM [Flavobacteriaceae bacterium]|nr:peptidoglycan-binding protein LysM [Flavobacteriaceae bacterium]
MKKNVAVIFAVLTVLAIVTSGFSSKMKFDFSKYKVDPISICYDVLPEHEMPILSAPFPAYQIFLTKDYVGFKEAIGFKESRGEYDVINELGYMGKYQFGRGTLRIIGIKDTKEFLENTRLQEAAFAANTARNKWILRRDIERFDGRYVGGVRITESGILAAAHLAGPGNVKKFLRSGGSVTFNDAFGTSIKHYLRKFSGYDTSFIVPNKKAKVRLI